MNRTPPTGARRRSRLTGLRPVMLPRRGRDGFRREIRLKPGCHRPWRPAVSRHFRSREPAERVFVPTCRSPSQHAQDVPCEAHGDAAAAAGKTWASWKTSPRIKVMTALTFMSGVRVADNGALPRIYSVWAFHAADLGTSADGWELISSLRASSDTFRAPC